MPYLAPEAAMPITSCAPRLAERHASPATHARHIHRPAARNLLGERRLSVGVESGHRDPLQRRPAVRRIPLLAGIAGGRDHAAPLEEAPSRGAGDRGGLGRGGGMHEQRVERGRRYAGDALAPCPLIIEIGAAHRVPEISVHRLAPGPRVLAERTLAGPVTGLATAGCDPLLEPEH